MKRTSDDQDLTRPAGRPGRAIRRRVPGSISFLLISSLFLQSLALPSSSASPLTGGTAQPQADPAAEVAVVRHAPVLNGRIEGSLRQLTGEAVTFNGGGAITGDLLVPGTPTVKLNGSPNYGGTINGTGSSQPTGYLITLNGGSTLGRLVKRTNPIALADVNAPPAAAGTRTVTINSPGQSAGDFATLRDLTLNGNVGLFTVPPGTYRNFIANGGGFILGIAGSTQPAIYNLSKLTLNGSGQLQIAGPVILTLGNALIVNGSNVGSASNPSWLTLKISSGGLTLNGNSGLYGNVRAPYGTVILNSASLQGSVHCDRLTINGSNSLLAGVPFAPGVIESISPTRATQGQTINVTVIGRGTHWVAGQTRASFGAEVSVGGSPAGELGPVAVINETTAVAELVVSPTAALSRRTVRVLTAPAGGSIEDISFLDGFTVIAISPPGAASTTVTTIAGSDNVAGFVDGPAALARFRGLAGIASGADDTIYVADAGNNRVRVVRELPNQSRVVQTLAGDGTAGFRDGAGAQARFNNPQSVAVDVSGNVYVADTGNHRIRRIAPDGTVTTVAGDGTSGYRNGAAAQARFNGARGLAMDQLGNLYIADTGNSALRRLSLGGDVQTVAGDGTAGNNDSPNAHFNGLSGVAVNGTSVLVYLSDTNNHSIRRLDPSGTVVTIAGSGRGFADGPAASARFAEPVGIAFDGSGNLVIADSVNSLIRSINLELVAQSSPLAVGTVAGTGERGLINGPGNVARFLNPQGISTSVSSAIFVADTGNNVLRRILMPPSITFINPARARANQTVVIGGERFDARAPGHNVVKFTRATQSGGGQTTAQVLSATQSELSVVVPADAATGSVTVTTEGGTATSPSVFEVYVPPVPVIVDFNPKQGVAGSTVTLTGSGLKVEMDETRVTFAGSNSTRLPALLNFANATEVQVLVPNGAVTGVIQLTTTGGSAATATAFTVGSAEDFQISVSPSTASAVQRSSATFIVSLTSSQTTFNQMGSLSLSGLPEGVGITFDPAQITSGARSTLQIKLADVDLSPGGYPFTIRATAEVGGRDEVRSASATLNVLSAGQTTLSGRVLSSANEPIMGATASLDGKSATTDSAGSFILSDITAGTARPVMVDGRTASSPNRTYPLIIEPADIVAGQANVVPYIFYLPPIDIQAEVEVVPGMVTVAHNSRLPGLEMTIPVGANLRNRDGSPVARVSITPLAIDRTPAPLPANVTAAMVFTSQPGGALTDVPIPVVYPNLTGANPGTQMPLYAFDHDLVEWYIYGTGRVSTDGRSIAPEINPATGKPFGLRDFSWHFPSPPPSPDTKPDDSCPKKRTGNPVDLSTGMKVETATDIAFGGARGGITLTRTYTSGLAVGNIIGRFGRGTKDNYDIRLTGTFEEGGAGRFVIPEGEIGDLYSYARKESGTLIFTSTQSVGQLGNEIRKLPNGTLEYKYANGVTLRFSSAGLLNSVADQNGNTTILGYSGTNLTLITDPVGREVSLTYDGENRITSATDPLGRRWQYAYNGNGMLIRVTNPLNQVIQYSYDGTGRLLSMTDRRGNIEKLLTYDAGNRVITQRFADGGTERYEYTFSGATLTGVTLIDQLGRRGKMRLNAAGYIIETMDRAGQAAVIDRDLTTGLPLSTSGPCGCAESTREFDARGNMTKATDRLGQTMNIQYEAGSNRLASVRDKAGRTISFTYDSRGNILSATDALGQTTRYEYDSFGQQTAITDPLGHTARTEYDSYGNVSARIDALDNRGQLEIDIMGRILRSSDPLGRESSSEYDALDRIISSTGPDGTVTRYFYDANSNLLRVTDAANHSWTGVFDSKNRVTSTTDTLGRITRSQYDAADELTATISPAGRTVRFTYDQRGQLATITDPLNHVATYKSDSRGNLSSIKDQRGYVTTFSYDELQRPTGMRDPLGRESRVTYNSVNKVTSSTDRLGQTATYTYDAANRPSQITFPDATVSYTYDAASKVTRIVDSQSGSVVWNFDAADRMLSETTENGTVSYTYNGARQVTSMRAADRAPVNYQYDSAGRLQEISQGSETFTYIYDSLSRLVGFQRPNGVGTNLTLDLADRLQKMSHLNSLSQPVEDFSFSYDRDDRIVSITSLAAAPVLPPATVAGTADAANRLGQFGSSSYSFDNLGKTTTKTSPEGITGYQWDSRGRLVKVTLPGGQTVDYGYDALGRRATRQVGTDTTTFLYDQADVVLDRAGDGSTVEYLNGIGIDHKIRQTSAATGPLYYLSDQLGSTIALTDASGNVVERSRYEPYGETSGSAFTRYGFTGRERDNLTRLMYYRARWYDPQQGRFISEDPAGFIGGLNKYEYVNSNPVSGTDPLGLYDIDVHYYLTYYLALKTGCYTDAEQRVVADSDQDSDENSSKTPGWGNKVEMINGPEGPTPIIVPDPAQRHRNVAYHAFGTHAQNAQRATELFSQALETGSVATLGTYMHFMQDSFSHADFAGNETWGQATGGKSVDHTNIDPNKAMAMAKSTFDALKDFGKQRGCDCDGQPDWEVVQDFISVGYSRWNPADFVRDVSDAQLRKKIRILGVPWRSPNAR